MQEYLTITEQSEASLTEKRSEFIAQLFPVKTADEALAHLETVRTKHHKARHHVWAYRLREGDAARCCDDGEPQGTGGQPVLGVLQRTELTDICCIVTRYFGGVLLGANGLSRAYASSAALAVQQAEIHRYCEAHRIRLVTDYDKYGRLSYLLPEFETLDAGSEFADRVALLFDLKTARYPQFSARMTELFNGSPDLTVLETHFVEFPMP